MSRRVAPRGNLLLAGATGLIGNLLLSRLLDQDRRELMFAPVRREVALRDRRLVVLCDDLADAAADLRIARRIRECSNKSGKAPGAALGTFVSCLGTTLKDAGSKSAFRAIDHDLLLRMARLARELGARQAIVVSSVGADPRSGNFYLQVKGEVEEAVAGLGFERVDFLRPGLLLGDRVKARRGESIAQSLAFLYNPLLRGPLQRYAAIRASTVADAIIALIGAEPGGRFVHENTAIQRTAK